MPQDERQLRLGELSVDDVQIGAADPAGAHLDQHLAGPGLQVGQVGDLKRLALPLEHHRAHGLTLAPGVGCAAMAEDYRQASLDIWEQMAAGWESDRRSVWESSRPVGEWLVGALDPQPGETILELAAGVGDTGIAAASRLEASGKLISTDFAAPMVEAARRRAEELGASNIEFRTMDAERMDLADDSVDGVVCRWGYMLMADPVAALRETRRVLRPGGRVAFSVWGDPAANPWASVPAKAFLDHTGARAARPERARDLRDGAGGADRRAPERGRARAAAAGARGDGLGLRRLPTSTGTT